MPPFPLDLGGEDEMERFTDWQEGGDSLEYADKKNEREGFGFGSLIAAYLLGGWFGRRR